MQLSSVAVTILCSGGTPVVGIFCLLFRKPAGAALNDSLEIEETLEKSKYNRYKKNLV